METGLINSTDTRRSLPLCLLAAACWLLLSGCRLSSPRGSDSPSTSAPHRGTPADHRTSGGDPATPHFTDVTRAAGIHFKHTNGRSGRLYFPETTGPGCAFLDYDNDGRLDIFLINGGRLPGFAG